MSKRGAFTLVELLVVIAIIAILAAVLFPVFARAREKARSIACLSNIRQLAIGVEMYTTDYEAYPLHSHKELGNPGWRWMSMLAPYVRNESIYQCPSSSLGRLDLASSTQAYGYNYQYMGNGRNFSGNGPALLVTQSDLDVPAETIAIADAGGLNRFLGTPDEGKSGYAIDPPQPNPLFGVFYGGDPCPLCQAVVGTRHNEGANFAFADGHAKWLRAEQAYADNRLWNGRGEPQP